MYVYIYIYINNTYTCKYVETPSSGMYISIYGLGGFKKSHTRALVWTPKQANEHGTKTQKQV